MKELLRRTLPGLVKVAELKKVRFEALELDVSLKKVEVMPLEVSAFRDQTGNLLPAAGCATRRRESIFSLLWKKQLMCIFSNREKLGRRGTGAH